MSANGIVRVGFASFDLKDCLPAIKPFHDSTEGRALYIRGEQQVLWFSLDLMMLSVHASLEMRGALARKLDISVSQIVIHLTHNHTAPIEEKLLGRGYGLWISCLLEAARLAMEQAEPACIAAVRRKVPGGIFVRRRQRFGSGLGDLCTYMGYELRDGEPDATRVNGCRISRWLGGKIKDYADQIPGQMIYGRPIDRQLDLVLFRSLGGRPLGGITRFAGHVIAAGHCRSPYYSADFPGVLRNRIESHFGGPCLAVNGPCGDITLFEQAPFEFPLPVEKSEPRGPICMPHKSESDTWREVERIGRGLSEQLAGAEKGPF